MNLKPTHTAMTYQSTYKNIFNFYNSSVFLEKHVKLACEFFLKEISYTTPSIFPKANEFKTQLKYGSIFPKTNKLKTISYMDDVPKHQ